MQINESFDININGTTSMTKTFNAYSFASKGHYYGMSTEAVDSQPRIKGAGGALIKQNEATDDSYLGVEK